MDCFGALRLAMTVRGRAASNSRVIVFSLFFEAAHDDSAEEAARDGTRLFALLLDEYHVSAGASTGRVREALTRFVDRELGARDLVAVLKPLDSLLTIRVTRDPDTEHYIEFTEKIYGCHRR